MHRTATVAATIAATSVVAASLSGCTAGAMGVTGVTRTAGGQPAIAVVWCDRKPARVFVTEVTVGEPAGTGHLAEYVAEAPSGGQVDIPLAGPPPPGWRAVTTHSYAADRTYKASATSRDNGYVTDPVEFRLDDLPPLAPGSVLITDPAGPSGATHRPYRVVGRDEFRALGRAACDGNG